MSMVTNNTEHLQTIVRLVRYYILKSTTAAGSGHPTSSLSAAELMVTLLFGGFFRFDPKNPEFPNNDRLVFSKGHATPLLYALWAAAGRVTERKLLAMRTFASPLEGHPTMRFAFTEAATGSLGQGLSVGMGMALNAKYLDRLSYRTFVLLGDSEMSEGAVWEAVQLAAHYKLHNLIGIVDVNRLGQRGETMYGHDLEAYKARISAFGWDVMVVNGHSIPSIALAYRQALSSRQRPVMILAKTFKGRGVSFLQDQEGWHGKPLNEHELSMALQGLGAVNTKARGVFRQPSDLKPKPARSRVHAAPRYRVGQSVSTRQAYGAALAWLAGRNRSIVALDAEVSNSTYSELMKKADPGRFFEMYVAEQNMAGAAVGLARRGKIPFVSSFGAFLTRAHDQIRMAHYSEANVKFVGSHAGVSVGEDGPSQMALEDIALFRSVLGCLVLYPCDAVSMHKLAAQAARYRGMAYIRATRNPTPVIYREGTAFPIGGSKVLRRSRRDAVTIVAAGITVHEALAAYEMLAKKKFFVRVIDAYSVKPLDHATLLRAARETRAVITVEDHCAAGGLGEAVAGFLSQGSARVYSLAVRKTPRSGTAAQLLEYEGISARAIASKALQITK